MANNRDASSEAAPIDRWTERSASSARHRAEAGDPLRDQEAHGAPHLALLAHGVAGNDRPAADQLGHDHLEQLATVDGTAIELEINLHVGGDGRGRAQR